MACYCRNTPYVSKSSSVKNVNFLTTVKSFYIKILHISNNMLRSQSFADSLHAGSVE